LAAALEGRAMLVEVMTGPGRGRRPDPGPRTQFHRITFRAGLIGSILEYSASAHTRTSCAAWA